MAATRASSFRFSGIRECTAADDSMLGPPLPPVSRTPGRRRGLWEADAPPGLGRALMAKEPRTIPTAMGRRRQNASGATGFFHGAFGDSPLGVRENARSRKDCQYSEGHRIGTWRARQRGFENCYV